MVFTMVVWLFALAMAYPYLPGSQSQAFQGLSVLVGLMVSIGASSTVGQAASGLILMYTRAFRTGEFVRINETEGTVMELGLFSTRIRTGMGDEVMLPNTMVLGTSTKNYSRVVPGAGFVVDTTVTIGYDTPWRQVHAMLIEAARRVPAISASPEPRVMQTALSDFYPEYRLIAYSRAEAPVPRAVAMSQLHEAIQDVFNEYGVQIMSPHYLGDPADAKVVPKARWFEKPAVPPAG
jgi:small-conductance mechanosensitive channel